MVSIFSKAVMECRMALKAILVLNEVRLMSVSGHIGTKENEKADKPGW